MQIHDITKRPKRTDEGLLDTLKAGIAGAKAVGQAAMSPTFGAVARNQGDLNAAEKSRQAINKKYGLDIQGAKRGASDLFAPPQATQATQTQAAVQQQVQAIVKTMEPEFNDLSAVLPDPGQVLVLKSTKDGAKYYKTEAGQWFVQPAVGGTPIALDDNQIKYAEGQIEKDQYGQEPAPTASTPTVTKEAAGISRAAVNAARKTAEQKLKASVAKVVAPLATKNKINAKNLLDGPEAAKAFQQINAISAAPASKIKTKKDKKQRIKQVFTQYATAALSGAQGEAQAAAAGNTTQVTAQTVSPQEQQMAQRTLVSQGQDAKTLAAQQKLVQQGKGDLVKQAVGLSEVTKIEKKLKEGLLDFFKSKEAEPDLPDLDDPTENVVVSTAKGDYVKSGADGKWRDPKGTVIDSNKYADYIAKLEKAAEMQSPVQTAQSSSPTASTTNKPTSSSAEDPTQKRYNEIYDIFKSKNLKAANKWMKQPDDYKDHYIKQLDSGETTLAHLLYHFAPVGSDIPDPDGEKWREIPVTPTPQSNYLRQQADAANQAAIQHRMQQFSTQGHNQQVQDTFNQLQNAKIFNTGQEGYLKDRLASLMAMKENMFNKKLDRKLWEALSLINEDQVRITKDITVRTAGGNYVKRASDQTWYDPNGVAIDPDKYADYVKRLDGTPQAQTQYQADANKGMTSSFQGTDKGFQAKQAAKQAAAQAPAAAAPAAAPDPVQQIADQQKMAAIMRSRDVAGLNSMINDTFNQLQNAKIFNTGQEPYLKDRMAQLMAMKV